MSGSVSIDPNASLFLFVVQPGSYVVVAAAVIFGKFRTTSVSGFPLLPCERAVVQETYTSTTMSVIVSVQSDQCSSALSTGAIIGIAVAATVGVVLIVLALVLLRWRLNVKRDLKENMKFKEREIVLLQRQTRGPN